MCIFRQIALSEFTCDQGKLVWGGAMMMRRTELESDKFGVRTSWLDGGFIDDMIVGSCVLEHQGRIGTPMQAIFPNRLKPGITFFNCWDFLRRQVFNLRTYSSSYMRRAHAGLFFMFAVPNSWISCGFIVALCTLVALPLIPVAWAQSLAAVNCLLAVASLFLLPVTALAFRYHIRVTAAMCNVLSPENPVDVSHVSVAKLMVAVLMQSALAPVVAVVTLFQSRITWGGITYRCVNGRVCSIDRPGEVRVKVAPRMDQTTIGRRFLRMKSSLLSSRPSLWRVSPLASYPV